MAQTMVYVQTGMEQPPMFTTCEPSQVLDTLVAMTKQEDGDNGTLDAFIEGGLASNEVEAALYYLGVEGEREVIATYSGTETFINQPGNEVFVLVRPMPEPGQIVTLWGEEPNDE